MFPNVTADPERGEERVQGRSCRRGAAPEARRRGRAVLGPQRLERPDARAATWPAYLEYQGIAASAPRAKRPPIPCPRRRRSSSTTAPKPDLGDTIAYLEKPFKVTVDDRRPTRASVRTSSSRSAGTPRSLTVPPPVLTRPRAPEPGRTPPRLFDRRQPVACTRAAGRAPRRSSGRARVARSGRSRPPPTGRWSTSMTGEIWTPVPHRNTSSAT